MKKTKGLIIKILFTFCFLFPLAGLVSKAFAYIPGDQPCRSKTECEVVEGYRTACLNGFCAYIPISPLEKTKQALEECKENGSTNLECYTIGTEFVDPENGTLGSFGAMTAAMAYSLIGTPPSEEDLSSNYKPNGALGVASQLVASLYSHPPASSITYFADVLHNLGLAKPAYAQGIGFSGMSNLLPLWKASRNLAYILFIVAFLYIGLAIMFRVKISPQAIVTIQSALPKLIIALILVTFSYAIVGLMIDLMYVLIYLGVLAIGQTGWLGGAAEIAAKQSEYSNLSFGQGLGLIFGGGAKAVWQGLVGSLGIAGTAGILLLVGTVSAPFAAISAAPAALLIAILGIIALFCIFKLFFALLGSYIGIILSIIIGPLQIMLGVLPGSQGGFGSWFKNLLANILVFPAVALAILIGWLLCGKHGPTWTPPVIAPSGGALTSILGFGILLLLPKIPDIIKNAFKMKPAGYGAAIGEATQLARMPFTAAGSAISDAARGKKFGVQLPARLVGGLLEKAGK